MTTLDDLHNKAKDDDTRALLREVADLVAADTRNALEASHTAVLNQMDREHAAALRVKDDHFSEVMSAKDATLRQFNEEAAALERTVAVQNQTIETQSQNMATVVNDHAIVVQRYERQLSQRNKEIERLKGVASNAQGLAVVGGFTALLLGVKALSD